MLSTRCSNIFPFLSNLYSEVASNRPRLSHGTRGMPWAVHRTIMAFSVGCHTLMMSTHKALKNILPWNRSAQKIDLQLSMPLKVLSGSLNIRSSLSKVERKLLTKVYMVGSVYVRLVKRKKRTSHVQAIKHVRRQSNTTFSP